MSHGVPSRNWSYPTAIKFGVGRIAELAEHAKSIGLKKPLLVTDKALASLPITSGSGSISRPALPTTSGRLVRFEQTTGAPHDIASSGFSPNPS